MPDSVLKQFLKLDFRAFPIMAAASGALSNCSTCPHKATNNNMILRAALLRVVNKPQFIALVKTRFQLPLTLAGITIEEKK